MSLIKRVSSNLTSSTNLSELSLRLHLVISLILLLQNIPITIYRYFHFPLIITYINIFEILIYLSAIALYYIDKFQLSIMISALGIPILFSYFTFINPIATIEKTFLNGFWFILGFLIIYSILVRENKFRILYLAFVFLIYFIPGSIISYNYPGNLIKIIQFSTLLVIPLIIAIFIEKQDSKITDLNNSLKKRLTEREELSQEIKEMNDELITFSQIMSHDLKAPIRTINSFTKLLRSRVKFDNEKDEQFFQFIEDSSRSMNDLINDLMTYHQIDGQSNKPEIIDLESLLHEIKIKYQFDINNNLLIMKLNHLPKVSGNRNLLKTLFHNLITNGIKYQPKSKIDHIPTICISSNETETHINVMVSDNGIGIDENYVGELFNPFQRYHTQQDYEGTGLGMSICKRVMDKHKGLISVENTSEEGTTIKLTFHKLN